MCRLKAERNEILFRMSAFGDDPGMYRSVGSSLNDMPLMLSEVTTVSERRRRPGLLVGHRRRS